MSGMLFFCMLIGLDVSLLPAVLHGSLELAVVLFAAWTVDPSILLFVIAITAGLVYTTCAYHQFYVLFQPTYGFQCLFLIESLFQAATYSLTFYYGLSNTFECADGIKVGKSLSISAEKGVVPVGQPTVSDVAVGSKITVSQSAVTDVHEVSSIQPNSVAHHFVPQDDGVITLPTQQDFLIPPTPPSVLDVSCIEKGSQKKIWLWTAKRLY